jgi:thiol-disulfide isomerase/thioredoxin
MKKLYLLHFFLALNGLFGYSQDSIHISGQLLNNTRFAKVLIKKFNVGNFIIAAVDINNNGSFSIYAPKNTEPGVYRFQYSQTSADEYIDIIVNGSENEVSFTLDINEAKETRKPNFTKSNENINWYQYQKEREVTLQKIQAMQHLVALYPIRTDQIVQQAQEAIKQEINSYYNQEAHFLKQNTTTWAGKMVANKPYYFTNPKDNWRLQAYEIKEHYWDNISTNNPELINSPLYTEHILEYLKYYMNPEMKFSEEEMNEGFLKSVDIIIQKFSGSDATKKFAIQYLQLGFKEIGNEKVLQYIDEKYKQTIEQCQDETDKVAFDKRVKGYATIKVGNKAPNILFTTSTKSLYDIVAAQTIVVFWASWCPHCQEELPKVNEWAKANPTTKVVAISLDEDKVAYENAIKQFPALLHDTDLKKWEGKAVKDYYVYGTPTFIVLDKDKNILGKLTSFNQLKTVLEFKK